MLAGKLDQTKSCSLTTVTITGRSDKRKASRKFYEDSESTDDDI
jgi:hypothetical protein